MSKEKNHAFYLYFYTGLAQCAELCWQLRGMAGKRQVSDAKIGLQHNIGLGGAVVVALYKKGFPQNRYFTLFILSYFDCNWSWIFCDILFLS